MGARRRGRALGIALVALASMLLTACEPPPPAPSVDFNGDGIADVAIGVPSEDIGDLDDAGAVHVLYGSAAGLSFDNDQVWDQSSPGVPGAAEALDHFGTAVTTGDFDGDGFSDLAIGTDGEDEGPAQDSGSVTVLYGSADGLTSAGSQLWTQDPLADSPENFDGFGRALAAGDLDGDERDDLAIGVPTEDVGSVVDAGAVNVIYGSAPDGLSISRNLVVHQNSNVGGAVEDVAETGERFGTALAIGDLDGDRDDLAVGVPGEDPFAINNAGAVQILDGSVNGLTAADDQLWSRNVAGDGAAGNSDGVGGVLAIGPLGGDDFVDLVVGVPLDDVGGLANAGSVDVLYGNDEGFLTEPQHLHQDRSVNGTQLQDVAEAGDEFGRSVVAADFNGDGTADLAIGAPEESTPTLVDLGRVHVLFGGSGGISAQGNQLWTQNSPSVPDDPEPGDRFGSALGAGDVDDSGHAELVVGVPDEDLGPLPDAGVVHVLPGGSGGPTGNGSQVLSQDTQGLQGTAEEGDGFGRAM